MKENTEKRSEAATAIHETARGLFEADVINEQTMREFDETFVTPLVDPVMSNQPPATAGVSDMEKLRGQEENGNSKAIL